MTDLTVSPLFQFIAWLYEKFGSHFKKKPLTPEEKEALAAEMAEWMLKMKAKGFHFEEGE